MGNVTAKTSGEIASFMSPAKTNIKSLKVHFSPKQLGTGDPSPENVREIVGWDGVNAYNDPKYVGNIVWNQLYNEGGSTGTNGGITYTKLDNGTWKIKGTSDTTSGTAARRRQIQTPSWEANHVYWFSARAVGEGTQYLQMVLSNSGSIKATTTLYDGNFTKPTTKINQFSLRVITQNITVDAIARPQIIDLTMLFGEEMADYIYNLEKSKSGAGKEYFFNLFPKDWYEYNAGELTTVSAVNNEPYTNLSYQWKKLPDEYQEVEWIASEDQRAFINTGVIGKTGLKMQATVMYTEIFNDCCFVGSRTNNIRIYLLHCYPSKFCYGYKSYATSQTTIEKDIKYNVETILYKGNQYVEVNGSKVIQGFDNNEYNNELPIYLFCCNYAGNRQYASKGRIYSMKLYDNEVIIRNFIPCYRKLDNEIGLYDIINDVFYTNDGAGTFMKGEDVDKTFYGGYVDLISGELVQDMVYGQVTSEWLSSRESGYIGYTSSITALGGTSGVWVRNAFTSTARERKSGGIKANCNVFKVLMNSTGVSSSQNRTAFAVDNESITSVADFISAVETLEQNGNGLYLAYELAEPITHQLTPTQLKSFVGQNNFWSNADYVEVEYDLIETEDIQKCRKKIILNQPQLKTVSDKIVSFNTDMVAPMKSCKIYFNPIQLGSGDPSPTNVRDINGWTSIDSYVNGDKINVDWTSDVGTVYGGYLDLAKNEIIAEKNCIDNYNGETLTGEWISDRDIYTVGGTPTIGAKVVYTLSEPIHYSLSSLTSQQLLTIKGWNNYWSNIDTNLEVKYWSHKIPPSESNIAYVGENLAFDGTVNNVIDTGIYLFNEENINRDFEVVVEGLYGNDKDGGGANTVICAKHNGNAYGFLVRINSNSNATYNGTITVKINYNNSLVIKRVNGTISISGDLITNPKVKFTNTVHQWPLVLGCAIDDDGTYYRFSKGSIKRIIVRWL